MYLLLTCQMKDISTSAWCQTALACQNHSISAMRVKQHYESPTHRSSDRLKPLFVLRKICTNCHKLHRASVYIKNLSNWSSGLVLQTGQCTWVYQAVPAVEKSRCSLLVEISHHWWSVNAAVPAQSRAVHSLFHDQLSPLSALHDISTSPAATPAVSHIVQHTEHLVQHLLIT